MLNQYLMMMRNASNSVGNRIIFRYQKVQSLMRGSISHKVFRDKPARTRFREYISGAWGYSFGKFKKGTEDYFWKGMVAAFFIVVWRSVTVAGKNRAYYEEERFPPVHELKPEEIGNNFIKTQFLVIKEQLLKLNSVKPNILHENDIHYDNDRACLVVYFNFFKRGNEHPCRCRHYYYLQDHPDMVTLENAINVDLAFKEVFFEHFPGHMVRTHQPENQLVFKREESFSGILSNSAEKRVPLSEFWDDKGLWSDINIRLKALASILAGSAMQDAQDKWRPTLRVTLPVFNKRSLTELPSVCDFITGRSWRSGCPVAMSDLSLLRVTHVNFNGEMQVGELMVHQDVAEETLQTFSRLFSEKFRIKQIKLIDQYFQEGECGMPLNQKKSDASKETLGEEIDNRSMSANNSSAFFARQKTGSEAWSHHATGKAIDINPKQNPYVKYDASETPIVVLPSTDEARRFARISNRELSSESNAQDGVLRSGSAAVRAFTDHGWFWGGDWEDEDRVKDYQHFSKYKRSEPVVVRAVHLGNRNEGESYTARISRRCII